MVASNAAREQTHSCEGADGHTPGPSFDPSNCIGNSGSGKSSFADGLGALIHAPVFDLYLIHGDDGFGAKQDEDMARQKVADLAATQRWVIEGVYGGCRKSQFQEQRPLCGLDVSWDVCREGAACAWPALQRDRGRFCRAPQMGRSLPGSPDADIRERSSIDNYPLEPSSTDDLRLRGAPPLTGVRIT